MGWLRKFILMTICLVYGCSEEVYDGFVYPDKENLFDYRNVGQFSTPEKCKKAAKKELELLHASSTGYYKCGINCVSKSGLRTVTACKDWVK